MSTEVTQEQRENAYKAFRAIGVDIETARKMANQITIHDVPKYQTIDDLQKFGVEIENARTLHGDNTR